MIDLNFICRVGIDIPSVLHVEARSKAQCRVYSGRRSGLWRSQLFRTRKVSNAEYRPVGVERNAVYAHLCRLNGECTLARLFADGTTRWSCADSREQGVGARGAISVTRGCLHAFPSVQRCRLYDGRLRQMGIGATRLFRRSNPAGCGRIFGYNCQLLAHNYYPIIFGITGPRGITENANGNFSTYSRDLIQQHT